MAPIMGIENEPTTASLCHTSKRIPSSKASTFRARQSPESKPTVATRENAAEIITRLIEEETQPEVLSSMPIIDRMKLAMKGTKGQRAVLIRDPNKLVAAAVLAALPEDVRLLRAAVGQVIAVDGRDDHVPELHLGGDLRHGTVYYEQAVALFREADNRTGLASSLTAMMLRSLCPMNIEASLPEVGAIIWRDQAGVRAGHLARLFVLLDHIGA